jgi:predicted RNA polymerase sigma factor
VPSDSDLPERLAGVLATVYLMFNEGYAPGSGSSVVRTPLLDESIRLGRLLHDLMPDEASVTGLLALMLLQDSRRAARADLQGDVVLLADQDRAVWDPELIRSGVELVGEALRRSPDRPDPYVVQAAIAACHALAPTYEETDWDAVISWYDVLVVIAASPVAELGRAAAIGERDGPLSGLNAVDAIDGLGDYAWWHASRAELLRRLGRVDESAAAVHEAQRLGLNEAHSRHLGRPA